MNFCDLAICLLGSRLRWSVYFTKAIWVVIRYWLLVTTDSKAKGWASNFSFTEWVCSQLVLDFLSFFFFLFVVVVVDCNQDFISRSQVPVLSMVLVPLFNRLPKVYALSRFNILQVYIDFCICATKNKISIIPQWKLYPFVWVKMKS